MASISILFIAIALSFDSMVVSVANGAHYHQMSLAKAFRMAFFFASSNY